MSLNSKRRAEQRKVLCVLNAIAFWANWVVIPKCLNFNLLGPTLSRVRKDNPFSVERLLTFHEFQRRRLGTFFEEPSDLVAVHQSRKK